MGRTSTRPRSRRSLKRLRKTKIITHGLRCDKQMEEPFEDDLFISSKKPQKTIVALLDRKNIVIEIDHSVNIEPGALPSGKNAYFADDGILLLQKTTSNKTKRKMLFVSLEKFRSMSGQRNFWKQNFVCKTATFSFWGGKRNLQVSF